MWSLLPRHIQILLLVAAAVIASGGLQVLSGLSGIGLDFFQTVELIAFLLGAPIVAIFGLCWRRIWRRFPWLGRKVFPDLNGNWCGTLHSTWMDPATGQCIAPIPITIVVSLGLFEVSVKLRTTESSSISTVALLRRFPEQSLFRIWYAYSNSPKAGVRHRSAPHDGVAYLDLDLDHDEHRLVGRYYTDRPTTGDFNVSRAASNSIGATART